MTKLYRLSQLMELQYQHDRQHLQSIIDQETALRSELATLQEHSDASNSAGFDDNTEMRSMGADVIWEQWLERSKTTLNMKLATVLAAKEERLGRVRQSFGKRQVAKAQADKSRDTSKAKVRKQQLESTISQELLKRQ